MPGTYVWLGHVGTLERYAHSVCVPLVSPPQEMREEAEVRGREVVVGVHFRIDGRGLRTGELPPILPAVVNGWQTQRLRGTVPRGRVGQAMREKSPRPKKLGSPPPIPHPESA